MVFAGMPGLHRLLYVSRRALVAGDADLEIGQIVHTSIHNNRHVAVTGLLLCHEDWFIQVLEGPADAVKETFDRIGRDPRHCDVKKLSFAKATGRLFADWDMCARRFTDLEDPAQATARLSPASMDPVKLMALLVQIANQTRAALAA